MNLDEANNINSEIRALRYSSSRSKNLARSLATIRRQGNGAFLFRLDAESAFRYSGTDVVNAANAVLEEHAHDILRTAELRLLADARDKDAAARILEAQLDAWFTKGGE